jgi:membrane-associated phospholipid phosphatase
MELLATFLSVTPYNCREGVGGVSMTVRVALRWTFVCATLAAVSIYVVDGAVATSLHDDVARNRAFINPLLTTVELLFGFPLSNFATGIAIVAASLVLFPVRRWRATAWLLFLVGATHLTARLIAGVSKNVFSRLRPLNAFTTGTWRDQFFVDNGSSFPSGHAVHFWALFFGLAIAFPRMRWPALALAMFVSLARVAVNDHYVSDVAASGAIAGITACGYAAIILPQVARARLTRHKSGPAV